MVPITTHSLTLYLLIIIALKNSLNCFFGSGLGSQSHSSTNTCGGSGNDPPQDNFCLRKEHEIDDSSISTSNKRLIHVRKQRAMLEEKLKKNGVDDARRLLRKITQHARQLRDIVNDEKILSDLKFITQEEEKTQETYDNHNRKVCEMFGWSHPNRKCKAHNDEFYRSNNVICVIQGIDDQDYVGYSLRLAQALMKTRKQDMEYALVSKYPEINTKVDRLPFLYFDFTDYPVLELERCAEQMAYDLICKWSSPQYTYAIMYRNGKVIFREPCKNCKQYKEEFGKIVTKDMDRCEIPLDYDEEFEGQSQ